MNRLPEFRSVWFVCRADAACVAITRRGSSRLAVIMFAVAAAVSAAMHAPITAAAPDQPEKPEVELAGEPYVERSYGIALNPPVGAQLREANADHAIVRMTHPTPYVIALFVRKSQNENKIWEARETALGEIGFAQLNATVLRDELLDIDGQKGWIGYFEIARKEGKPWVLGIALMRVDPKTYAMLWLEVDRDKFVKAKAAFEAVIGTWHLVDPKELGEERKRLLDAGADWRQQITAEALRDAIRPQQLFRILDGERDVGWMRIDQSVKNTGKRSEFSVTVRSRVHLGQNTYDTESLFTMTEDRMHEVWSIKTTVGPVLTDPNARRTATAATSTWSEVGTRDRNTIRIQRRGAGGPKNIELDLKDIEDVPAEAYLSQVELHLMPALLDPEESREMGFYAYYPNNGKLAFRRETVEATRDGLIVKSTPSPEQPTQVSQYNRKGEMTRRDLAEGKWLKPTNALELRGIWKTIR